MYFEELLARLVIKCKELRIFDHLMIQFTNLFLCWRYSEDLWEVSCCICFFIIVSKTWHKQLKRGNIYFGSQFQTFSPWLLRPMGLSRTLAARAWGGRGPPPNGRQEAGWSHTRKEPWQDTVSKDMHFIQVGITFHSSTPSQ
jgi:hypothetical protein